MLHNFFKRILKALKLNTNSYKSYPEANRLYVFLMKVVGATVRTVHFDSNNQYSTQFTILGACGFLFWNILYFYNAYIVYLEDQTILRYLYDTKLKHYGDDLGRIVSLLFVVYMMWKLPFNLSGNTLLVKNIFDLDAEVENLGIKPNYAGFAYVILISGMGQMTVLLIRLLSLSLVHKHIMPRAILMQLGYSDSVAMIYTTHLAFSLLFLRKRYQMLNKTLSEIKLSTKSYSNLIFVVPRKRKEAKWNSFLQQDKLACFKVRVCSKIYSQLYKASMDLNRIYGFATTLTMLFSLLYIILNLFYFMEATASGLFHDVERYTNFVIYVFWQISYALGIIFLIVYFCVSVVEEAKHTAFITHEIINTNCSPELTEEAMQLSMQQLHQKPEFTACRLVKLDYELILQGARTVATIMVTLVQFLTD